MSGRVVRAKSPNSTLALYPLAPPSVPSHLIGAGFRLQVLGCHFPFGGLPGFPLKPNYYYKANSICLGVAGTFNILGEKAIKCGGGGEESFEVREGQTGSISPMAVEVSCL